MQPLRWERRPDGLRAPALVCAFKCWNDAGEAATSALTFMGAALDALLAEVPHTPRVSIPGFASDDRLIGRLGMQPPTYEGPTGIVGVLQQACQEAGMPAASLWAAVPHYVAVAPNPKGALAVLRRLESLVGVTVDAMELETAAVDYDRQVTRAVELDPEV